MGDSYKICLYSLLPKSTNKINYPQGHACNLDYAQRSHLLIINNKIQRNFAVSSLDAHIMGGYR